LRRGGQYPRGGKSSLLQVPEKGGRGKRMGEKEESTVRLGSEKSDYAGPKGWVGFDGGNNG